MFKGNKMKVGGCQLPISADIGQNIITIKNAIDWAANDGVDIFLTPECALSGYLWRPENSTDHRLKKLPEALATIVAHAKSKNVDLALGTGIYEDDSFEYAPNKKWHNQLRFYVAGELVHKHNKILTTIDEPYYPGTTLDIFEYKGIKSAGLICNDLWICGFQSPGDAGRLARELKNKEVKLCFVAANAPKMPSDPDYFYAWSDINIQTYSRQGNYAIIVSENYNLQNGTSYSGKAGTPSGIMDSIKGWVAKTPDTGLHYYSYSLNF